MFTCASVRSLFLPIVLLFMIAAGIARGQSDAPASGPFAEAGVMHVGFLNTDCVLDTVYGYLAPSSLSWHPRFIRWGRAFDAEGSPICDSGTYDASIPASRRVDTTRLLYPDWLGLSSVLSVQRYNANDSLDDMIFWLRGTDSLPRRGLVDTARNLVLFGQRGLDTLSSIDLAGIGTFRDAPFHAMELRKGHELVNPRKRDMTRKKSRELVRVSRNVLDEEEEEEHRDTTEAPSPALTSAVPGDPAHTARVYPNPAITTTNVEVRPLPPGSYTVEVVAVSGEEAWRGEVVLDKTGEIFSTIDLDGLPSGYYIVRIYTDNKIIGTYPVVVTR